MAGLSGPGAGTEPGRVTAGLDRLRVMRRRRRTALLAIAAAVATAGVGCGAEDFENNPRPPAPIQLTAKVDDRKVLVSPTEIDGEPVGAGLATVTISNQTDSEQTLTFSGPTEQTTDPIVARGVLEFKLNLDQGDYTVSADDPSIRDMEFEVGPERPSAQNDLLLP